jgi:triacylglycerol lipase
MRTRQGAAEQVRSLVLLHGLGRSPRAMLPLAMAARRRGYRVLNLGYRSRAGRIAAHAEWLVSAVDRFEVADRLYFATHSLGGIVLRYAVAHGMLDPSRIARAVMLAPPNQGSEVASYVLEHRYLKRLGGRVLGPSGHELGLGERGLVRQLPPVEFDVGVIAGSRALNPAFRRVLHGPNDGTVTVQGTIVDGMRDHVVVPCGHTFIMASPQVLAQTFHFLEHGSFIQQRA